MSVSFFEGAPFWLAKGYQKDTHDPSVFWEPFPLQARYADSWFLRWCERISSVPSILFRIFLMVDSPFFSTIVLFNTQQFP